MKLNTLKLTHKQLKVIFLRHKNMFIYYLLAKMKNQYSKLNLAIKEMLQSLYLY